MCLRLAITGACVAGELFFRFRHELSKSKRALETRGSESGALSARAQIDAGLVAGPHLPEAPRAGILAMVQASE